VGGRLRPDQSRTFARSIDALFATVPCELSGGGGRPVAYRGNEKEGISAMLTVTATGIKLPTIFVKSGKTDRCLKSLELDGATNYFALTTPTGWVNNLIVGIWLDNIIIPYARAKNRRCAVFLDTYKAHWQQHIVDKADANNIALVCVPPGKTATLQPLDIRVNGAIKRKMKSLWRNAVVVDQLHRRSQKDAVCDFRKAYDKIDRDVIVSGFNHVTGPM